MAYVTCPNCQTELAVDFKKAKKEAAQSANVIDETEPKSDKLTEETGEKAKKEG